MKYFITYNGVAIGPMDLSQIFAYPVDAETLVCTEENKMWKPLYAFPELMSLLTNSNCGVNSSDINTTGKDKVLCGILALLLGGLGIQYFYIGKTTAGIISIILTLVTCGSIWPLVTFIQGILILTMTQQQFEQKYVLSKSTFPVF